MPKHLLEIDDLSAIDIAEIIRLSHVENPEQVLRNKGAALLFEKPSNRTRNSMEMAIIQLGGHPITIRPDEVGIGTRESAEDVARTLSCYHALIGARVFAHSTVEELSSASTSPVVNMLSDKSHPLQALADLLTIWEEYGTFEGCIVAYVGDANNVARSLAIGCGLMGIEFRVAHPNGYGFSKADEETIRGIGTQFSATNNPAEAVTGASVVYTDVWASMGQEEEREKRLADFEGYTVGDELFELSNDDSIFMHCLPAHPGEEVSRSVLDNGKSRIWEQAENRMHAARGFLLHLFQEENQ
ncbi:MAG TPA: ornithine carbamoyltransferase [Acidimicrobiaceae bacterium]|nr:ornithine carbamoyltransferase [Acidimicrobiaceae bacterium]|tara:strand:+ start:15855 stop:16754 length:900 start_codon:yes stop_codon:yes gene_type:complete